MSTIEAIEHTAVAAGMNEEEMEKLLLLFKVQKYHVLGRIEEERNHHKLWLWKVQELVHGIIW